MNFYILKLFFNTVNSYYYLVTFTDSDTLTQGAGQSLQSAYYLSLQIMENTHFRQDFPKELFVVKAGLGLPRDRGHRPDAVQRVMSFGSLTGQH